MRSVLILSLIALCLLPLSITSADSVRGIKVIHDLNHQNRNVGDYRAIVIGINDYQDDQIPDLETARNDALAMAKLLQTRYGFKIDSRDILLDHKATRGAIYNALRKLAATAAPSDSVLIYYAGHGDLDKVFNTGWWIPADAKAGDASSYLDNVQVQMAMSSMKARHVLLVSDSCYSGTLFGKSRAIPKVINDRYYLGMFNEKSRWGMTSGNKTPVSDSGSEGHSVFAYQLLKELSNNEKPYISAQEIYDSIAPIISNNSDQIPMCNPIMHTGDQGGRFIFIASSGTVVDEPVKSTRGSKTLLSVNANVPDAKVYVDGTYVGSTNLIDKEVTPGLHRVQVERKGYQPYSREVNFKQGREKSFQAILDPQVPTKGSLYVRTDPPNASIRILNIVPEFNQGMELAPGRYHLEVSAIWHTTRKGWVNLTAGEDKELDIRLEPLKQKTTASSDIRPTKEENLDRQNLIDQYQLKIAQRVNKNWTFSEQLARADKSLMASLVFKVMPDGEIRDIFFIDRSNNEYLDDSAYRAVAKTNPAPPHPIGLKDSFVDVELHFTPEGIQTVSDYQ